MAATPPRPASPAPRPVVLQPKPGHNLQISPNLEALLQHDELTRRNSSSPTSAYHPSPSSAYPISLPPPPPRNAKGGRKAVQESFPTARGKEGQRRKSAVVGSDFWPDALDGSAAGQSTSGTSSRPVTPNPYLNPTPVLRPINTPDLDEALTPKQADKPLPDDPRLDSLRSASESRGRTYAPDPSQRPFHKVEKILWMGRDSLNLFSGSANAVKRDRNDRADFGDLDAVQDSQMWQVPVPPIHAVSRPASGFGDKDTATVTLSSKSATSYLYAFPQGLHIDPPESTSYLTHGESGPSRDPTPTPPSLPPAQRLPRPSLPSTSMPHNLSQRTQSVDTVSRDYLSFIDFFSPSTAESNFCNIQDSAQEISSPHPRLQSIDIPPSSLYATSHHNRSSTSLTSMKFAPPSPTALTVHQLSPTSPGSDASSSSVTLSTMKFAPPSPSAERVPSRLQPLSDPPSPYSPLEFALPPGPQHDAIDEPCLLIAPELPSDRGRKLKSKKKRSKSSSPYHIHNSVTPLPPTTNELDANERADRIRRNRKLARVFGRTPGVEEPIDAEDLRVPKKSQSPSLAALLTKTHRHAVSVSVSVKAPGIKTEPSTPWQTGGLWSPDGRRHSTPLATDFTLYKEDEQNGTPKRKAPRSRKIVDSPDTASTRSFIDLSDEEIHDDDMSEQSCFPLRQSRHKRLQHSTSTPSFVESLDSEAQAELERRRKREKLVKLHRFLGSRVPPEAIIENVFGPSASVVLPEESNHEQWVEPTDEFDRGKEELDEKEKALNVRRAQKMERVFGTPPPQVLFHTRQSRPTVLHSQPTSPADFNPYVLTLDLPSSSRNPNQSAYMGKTPHRPGPSDSSRCLLPRKDDTPQSSPSSFAQSFTDSFAESLSGYQQVLAQSSVYLNYQHSLNSLIDIIDRDDRESLIELHRFLHGEADDEFPEDEDVGVDTRRFSNAVSLKSERRHSLPSKASMTSLSSEFYTSPKASQFQIRRRKAAKLTNFFGVDYRELIQDVLESIEKGVEEERKQGTLQPEEVEVLMYRVRSLRSMKDPFHS